MPIPLSARTPESCPHREASHGGLHHCGLVDLLLDGGSEIAYEVSLDVCQACCRSFEPTVRDWSPVIASLVWSAVDEILTTVDAGRGDEIAHWQALLARAESSLPPVFPEEDDLPAAISSPPPPPARQTSRRKRQDSRGPRAPREPREPHARDEGEGEAEREREPAKPALRRQNVILVNAADREEVRVAVVENHQIVDFQLTVRKHKLLVNDIYRGRVVNLEPAIGAAFVDFGQGRNGFLHTSDVLSVYGDKDFSLQKLLSAKIDPDEWDRDDVQTDGAPEPREIQAPAPPQGAAAAAPSEGVESGLAPENAEDFAEIVDDHHELHVAEAARAARAEEDSRTHHDHSDHHEDLFSFHREDTHSDLDLDSDAEHAPELPDLPEATTEVGFESAESEGQGSQASGVAPAALSEGGNNSPRGRRTLRKTRGAARETQGGARGRNGPQHGNGTRRQARPRLPITELLQKDFKRLSSK